MGIVEMLRTGDWQEEVARSQCGEGVVEVDGRETERGKAEILGGIQRIEERCGQEGSSERRSGQKNGNRPSCQRLADSQGPAARTLQGP